MQFQILIDGKDTRAALPVKWNALLDERLDEGRLSLRHEQTKLYRIGAPVSIKVNNTQKDFIVSADESTEIPVGSGYYNHELSLIEPTKLLEGIVVESITFTNNLGRTYNVVKVDVEPIISPAPPANPGTTDLRLSAKVWMQGPVNVGDIITVPSTSGLDRIYGTNGNPWPTFDAKHDVKVIDPSGDVIYSASGTYEPKTITIDKIGQYRIVYTYGLQSPAGSSGKNYDIEYTFLSVDTEKKPLQKWNICTVLERVLNLAEPHLQIVAPRYNLDPGQAVEFENILAPEFAFTKCTLKEILDQIGGFIHGIPRLTRGESGALDTIRYDMLGGTEEALISSNNIPYITEIHSQNIEDYVTELDSTVYNLVNTLNSGEGSVTEPYAGGFKSVRSEEAYARIEEGNMVISTSLPIYSIQKLEVIDTTNKVGDITAYVFEGAEYGRLSSFDGNYPMSKAYAIYYNLGEKNIKGLSYKSPNVIGASGAKYSIANIIEAATGDDNITSSWWGKDGVGNYPRLAFRITYTPIFSARILQHKPYTEADALKRSLVYNQGANLVETRYYGENMRGVIARLGNPELTRSYRMPDLTNIPTIGQVFKNDGDDYYITSVTVAVYAENVDFTVGMSKDFNRLSQYIGINSEWRAYEVSERKAYNRDMVYCDFCVIGDPVSILNSLTFIGKSGLHYIANAFSHSAEEENENYCNPLTVAQVTTYDEQGNDYSITLPVVSTAFGNAMVFSFGMADNYSAGAQSILENPNNTVTGYWQTDVPYVDYYGRVKSMEFKLGAFGTTLKFGDAATFELPKGNEYVGSSVIGTPSNNRLEIDKNGTEILHMNYQLEFVSNWKDLIIGSALARNCLMVNKRETDDNGQAVHATAVYVLNKKVGRFDSKIDISSATLIHDYRNKPPAVALLHIKLGDIISTASGVAWAIADQSTGEILLARNMEIAEGDTINLPWMSCVHTLP